MSTMPPPPPYQSNVSAVAVRRDGRLLASGVMMIIQAAITLIVGLWIFSLSQSDSIEWFDEATGGTITFIALVTLLIGGGLLWTGIGAVRSRGWARITTIVLQSIFVALVLLGAVNSGDLSGALLPLVWGGTILGLAVAGKTA